VNPPNLQALQRGDGAAWDEAFVWLWPAAFGAAQSILTGSLNHEAEDVAIEALEELIEKVRGLRSVEELKPLVASIAHHRAVSRLRAHFAPKRGGGQMESLEGLEGVEGEVKGGEVDSPLAALEQKELSELLGKLLCELKPPQGEIFSDFFSRELSYDEIAKKHGLAIGSVGVYLKRGLEGIRRVWPPGGGE
jgi:RNA polymerase sigma factor (sigma-70 family)